MTETIENIKTEGISNDMMVLICVCLLIISIYICYCYLGKPEEKPKEEIKTSINGDPPPPSNDPLEMILSSQRNCPVMGGETKISVCIKSPDYNSAFIVSVCCENCIGEIQNSLNNGGIYKIDEENNMNILYKNDKIAQIVPMCSEENIKLITENLNTKLYKN
jgi:hypothetical protein